MVEEGVHWFGDYTPNVVIAVVDTPKGLFDSADCSALAGWACDPNDYSSPVSIHFYANGPVDGGGTFIGSVIADQSGGDAIGSQCGGNQNHRFVFPLPASVKDGASHRIYAYAVNIPSGSNPLLAGSPRSIQCSSNDAGFVSQDVPNPMCIGQTYPVRVTMKNTGSSTWTAAANYRLGSQNPQDNTIWGIGRVDLLPVDAIAPMQNKDFVFSVSAPPIRVTTTSSGGCCAKAWNGSARPLQT